MAMLGGGNFTGKAVYDTGTFPTIAEDVSDIVSMISPYETPLLSQLGDAELPARNVLHEWLEDELAPNTLVTSNNISETATTVTIANSLANYIMVGAILRYASGTDEEYIRVTGINGNDITISRGFASTTAVSITTGSSLSVISDAAQEGADVTEDITRPRTRLTNYTQIFKKDVIVSGTMGAMNLLGGIADEKDYQIQQRTREALRDLEKAVILSKTSGNTIGSSTAVRTMNGLLAQITTNSSSVGAINSTNLNAIAKLAWDEGGSDIDLIVCGQTVKESIDALNTSRIRVGNEEDKFREVTTIYEGTYGQQAVVLSRWMPANVGVMIAKARVKVVPLSGRSFTYQSVAKTGDSEKGMVLGEYTLELRNEKGMVKFNL